MVNFSVSIKVLCLAFITASLAGPSVKTCKLQEVSTTASGGDLIKVGCDGKTIIVDLLEGGSYSTLKIIDENGKNLLTVDYFKNSHDMFIVIDGEQFDVKDEKTKVQEAKKFKELLDDPKFEFFPEAVRLIHDELQLKGWESPAVMFLYRMGIAAESYHIRMNKRSDMQLRKRFFGIFNKVKVDPKTYDYHGPNPKKRCTYGGWSDPSMDNLIDNTCRGVCGQTCSSCWTWVCGDCCMHTGCKRHDEFCSGGYLTPDCYTARGVLWDTITDVPLDC